MAGYTGGPLFGSVCCSDKATNPRNRYEDWEFIMGFCDKVNADLQGLVSQQQCVEYIVQHACLLNSLIN